MELKKHCECAWTIIWLIWLLNVDLWPPPPPCYLNLLWLEPGETRFEIECDNLIWMIRLNIELFIDYWLGDLWHRLSVNEFLVNGSIIRFKPTINLRGRTKLLNLVSFLTNLVQRAWHKDASCDFKQLWIWFQPEIELLLAEWECNPL